MKPLVTVIVLALIAYAIFRAYQSSTTESKELGTVKSLPPSVQQAVIAMSDSYRASFFAEYDQKRKKASIAYILWFLFGFHYVYLGKIGLQFAYWFTLGGLGIWWLIDLFRMPSLVRQANEQVARVALQTLQVGASFNPAMGTREQPQEAPWRDLPQEP